MTRKGKKLEPKLYLDLDFDEALERFAQTDPKEVDTSIKRAKKKKPPGNDPGGLKPKSKGEPREGRKRQPSRGTSGD